MDAAKILDSMLRPYGYSLDNPPPPEMVEYLKKIYADYLPGLCSQIPKSDYCDGVQSYYMYEIDLVPNAAFVGIFGASLVAFLATYAATRRGLAFGTAMCLGVTTEILGYAGRIMSWNNQWDENGFLMQVCCLTIGPAFLAAGIYLCLRRIVTAFGPKNSRIAPEWYTRIFIPCDLISLILQAVGGALASVANHNGESTTTGDNVMIAGLSFQVFTMFVFMLAAADFALRTYRRARHAHLPNLSLALDNHPDMVRLRASRRFRAFLWALVLSTACIFIRCVFRVVELSGGWTGPLMERQDLFIGFEGVMIATAVLALNFFHPAFCSKELLDPAERKEAIQKAPAAGERPGVRMVNFLDDNGAVY